MLKLEPLPQAPVQSATDLVFDTIYQAVVQLDLPPGTRLSEAEVAGWLHVSRQPVRDAFYRLAHRGFLSIRPQRATLVTKISETEVLRAAFIRIALETACIREAIGRVTEEDISGLRAQLARQAEAVRRQDSRAFHGLDEAFHATLCDIAGQPKVWGLIHEQKGHMDRARFLSLSFNQAGAHGEHAQIVEALAARDTGAAIARLEMHLSKIRGHLGQIRQAHGAFFEDEP
ncbi:GntR family transcriptional regulator [Roseicyclus sp.]|uniref:GntR family transcriptional regulator n=1 Tax=Roseicyclus sp. TaxID=1914329 RepID=UPI003F9F77D5